MPTLPSRVVTPARLRSALALALLLVSCTGREDVDLSFRPRVGSRITYSLSVETTVVTALGGRARRRVDRVELLARQELLEREPGGVVHVKVEVGRRGERARRFDLELDPRRGLASVRSVEGLPPEVLGEPDASSVFTLATGLVPDHRLRPGEQWRIGRTFARPEGRQRLTGTGRLAGLRDRDGVDVARVEANTLLPSRRRMSVPEGDVTVEGSESTRALIEYAVDDGTVRSAHTTAHGHFRLSVRPPGGTDVQPVTGTLEVTVESTVRRTG